MRVDVVTVFPDYLAPLELSLVGRARRRGLLDVRVHDLREHTDDVHRTVDDAPFGGGPGMLMRPEPWGRALDGLLDEARAAGARPPRLLVPTPAGRPFTQADAARLADEPWLVVACGRYEGLDARVTAWAAEHVAVEEISLGDYVLAGGEVAALVLVEAVARLLPGVLGNEASAGDDSHADGLLEAPAWTRPASWRGHGVPEVLRSGDHGAVAAWRRTQSLRRTASVRPDLARAVRPGLDDAERAVLDEALAAAARGGAASGAGGASGGDDVSGGGVAP